MTNNKQSMKLYTAQHFLQAAEFCEVSMIDAKYIIERIDEVVAPIELPSDSLCINCDDSKSTHNICMDCIIKIGKENIELPTDEDVEQYLKSFPYTKHLDDGQYNDGAIVGAELAIQWMRDKIQGGNK